MVFRRRKGPPRVIGWGCRGEVILLVAVVGFAPAACGGDDSAFSIEDDSGSGAHADGAAAEAAVVAEASVDASVSDSRDDKPEDSAPTLNACGGPGPLLFDGGSVSPGASCGPCSDGVIVCASPTLLGCVGARPASACGTPPPPNACGGTAPLVYENQLHAPADPCGTCLEGTLICASPNLLYCSGANPSCDGGAPPPDAGPPDTGPPDGGPPDAGPTCDIPASAYTATAPSRPGLAAETAPSGLTYTTIAMAANALVANPTDGLLYASVPSSQGAQGNSIATIDPVTAKVLATTFVGSEPGPLALSDDGSTLWVGLTGANAVRRFDTASRTPGTRFSTRATPQSLAAVPGTTDSVMVLEDQQLNYLGVYDNGVRRPVATRPFFQTAVIATYSPSLFFSFEGYSSGFRLTTLCVNASGVFESSTPQQVFSGYYLPFAFSKGILYGGDGRALDIQSNTLLGTYSGGGWPVPDDATGRVFFLAGGNSAQKVTAFDQTQFVALASDTYGSGSTINSFLVRWGRYGFAFLSATGYYATPSSILIGRSPLVPSVP